MGGGDRRVWILPGLVRDREPEIDSGGSVGDRGGSSARELPHVFRAYTRDELTRGEIQHDFVGERVANGFFETAFSGRDICARSLLDDREKIRHEPWDAFRV